MTESTRTPESKASRPANNGSSSPRAHPWGSGSYGRTFGQTSIRIGYNGWLSRDRSRRKKNQEKDAPPEKIKRKIVFSDLRNPPKNFTPLFGEVAKFRTLTEKDEP